MEKIRKVLNLKTLEYEDLERPSFPSLDAARKAGTLTEKINCVLKADDKAGKFAWKLTANSFSMRPTAFRK